MRILVRMHAEVTDRVQSGRPPDQSGRPPDGSGGPEAPSGERQAPSGTRQERLPAMLWSAVTASALAWGAVVSAGAQVLHYDARAHLVVARRVLDNLTPGWIQLGAVWLPLPHLLNVLPARSDFLYRTGLFASFLG